MVLGACRRSIFAALAVALAGSAPAAAGKIVDGAAETETLLNSGAPGGALEAFDRTVAAFWEASPLQFRTAGFVDRVDGYGKYETRGGRSYKAGDSMTVYVEPVGFRFVELGGDTRAALAADVEIRTPGGLILAKKADFGRLEWTGKSREVHAAITIPLPKLKPGDYELVLTFRDQNSPKTTTLTLSFAVTADDPQ